MCGLGQAFVACQAELVGIGAYDSAIGMYNAGTCGLSPADSELPEDPGLVIRTPSPTQAASEEGGMVTPCPVLFPPPPQSGQCRGAC